MKNIETSLAGAIAGVVTTLAVCYRITRNDGVIMGFTGFDQDLTIAGIVYTASASLSPSAIESTADLRVDNMDIQGVLSDARIREADLLNGVYDGAEVAYFLVDYKAPPATVSQTSVVWLCRARIAQVRVQEGTFVAELRGLAAALEAEAGELYSPTCRAARLGDARCGVALGAHTAAYSVAAVLEPQRFSHSGAALADAFYRYGWITFTSGANAGREYGVKAYRGGVFELVDAPLAAIAMGDGFTAVRGCDRRFETCRDVFANAVNFRGEPPHLLPGDDRLLAV